MLDSPADLYYDTMPTRMKLSKVFLNGFTTLTRSASTEANVLYKCGLLNQSWVTLLYKNALGRGLACQNLLATQVKVTNVTLLL